ncbi:MAG TPA: translation initiation factor IF-2 subunit gamma [Thermoplasmata archaeon]|nr:translation initiation factor IF-2 subunit gamma [Thermoplasmata archaeon]
MKVPGQPAVNIGVVGHVDHGKSTLTERLTGDRTDRHSEEIKRGISIRLGYADMAIYRCPKCEEPQNYSASDVCKNCGSKGQLQRIVSFVDAPGHETLMATMLSGAAIMDGALLVIAANEACPQPQTKEHLMALGIIGVEKIVIVQNKIDLVDSKQALENCREIEAFVKGTVADGAPIIPVSAHHDVNLDALLMLIETTIPTRPHEEDRPAKMYVARSFDVNQPGSGPEKLVGGVLGGSLVQGKLKVGDEVEIAPGRQVSVGNKTEWRDIRTTVRSLHSGGTSKKEVRPGGLVAIGTNLDPVLTKADSLVGRVVGPPGSLPEVMSKMSVEVNLLERVVGTAEDLKVEGIKTSEPLMVSVGTATTVGVVTSARERVADMSLKIPVIAETGQRVAVSRRIGGKWRLIGYGVIRGPSEPRA